MWTLLIFLLNPLFFEYSNQKPVLKIRESLPSLFINLNSMGELSLNDAQNFKILIRQSDWLNSIHFSAYKHKIRLVSRLRRREDQALISKSTILKFSAQVRRR